MIRGIYYKMSDNNDDPIGEALGIEPLQKDDRQSTELVPADHNQSVTSDFENARVNIYTMIDTANEAIERLHQIADQSQQPRAFEVLGKLIETSVKANKDLLELQEKMKQLKEITDEVDTRAKTINNNLFVGSTKELQDFLKKMKNEK